MATSSRNPDQRCVAAVTLQSQSEHETRAIGRDLGRLLQAGDVLCLEGELGTGKTVLAQGLAEGLGVADQVTSPSFTLIHEHQGRLPLYHVDLYRLSPTEAVAVGLEQYLHGSGATVIEWAERLPADECVDCLWIRLRYLDAVDSRELRLSTCGERAACLLGRFEQDAGARAREDRQC